MQTSWYRMDLTGDPLEGRSPHLLSSVLSLPKVVKRRVNGLKNLQVKCAHIEAKFYEEVHELERKYAALYQPLFDKVRHCDLYCDLQCLHLGGSIPWGRFARVLS